MFQQVLSTSAALLCIERVARYHLRDYLKVNLDEAVRNLSVLFPLLALVDMELHQHIEGCVLIAPGRKGMLILAGREEVLTAAGEKGVA